MDLALVEGNGQEVAQTVENYFQILSSAERRQLITAAVILVLGILAVKLIIRLVKKGLKHSRVLPPSTHTIVLTILRFVLYFVVVVTAANAVGIPISSFVAILSVVGIAVSLAVQGLLSNLVGGFILLGAKPFEVGDFVEADGVSGSVAEIGTMYTRLQAPDGRLVFIPNSSLNTQKIINYTALGKRRITLTFSVSYDDPPEKVREAVLLAAERVGGFLAEPAPMFQLETYGDSAIGYNFHIWCDGADFIRLKYELNETLYTVFREKGVTFTYPHLNVHTLPAET